MSELKPCPFCGSEVQVEKVPLWRGSHGYNGCYDFIIKCQTCGARPDYTKNDTIYRTEEEAKENAIKAWNRRPDKSKAFQRLAEGLADINPKEIRSHDTEDRMAQWIKSWNAYMQKWLWILDQELKDWEGE